MIEYEKALRVRNTFALTSMHSFQREAMQPVVKQTRDVAVNLAFN